ncbi:MAG: BolA family protein [Hydrogenophilus sp.]
MNPKEKTQAIRERLTAVLSPYRLQIEDQSHLHAGHNPAAQHGGTHYAVTIVSDQFAGKRSIERHRMVYDALGSLMNSIHALAITAKTPDEP